MEKIIVIFLIFISTNVSGQNSWITADNPVQELKPNIFIEFSKNDSNSIIKIVDKEQNKEYLIYDNGLTPVTYIERCILKDSLLAIVCHRNYRVEYWLYKFDDKKDKYLIVNKESVYGYVGVRATSGPRKSYFVSYNLISVNTMEKFSEDPARKDIIVQYDTDWGKTIYEKREVIRQPPANRN